MGRSAPRVLPGLGAARSRQAAWRGILAEYAERQAAESPSSVEQAAQGAEPAVKRTADEFDRTFPATPELQRAAIKRIIEFARKIKNRVERAVIGGITMRQSEDFKNRGIDVDGTWVHSFESSAVTHNQKHHGSTLAERHGQIAITEEEYERIPEILEAYDDVYKSPNKSRTTGNEVIIYEKEFDDGYVYYLEEKRDKRKSLSFQTMYKKKKRTDSSDGLMPNASPSTSVTPSDNLSSDGKDNTLLTGKQGNGGESLAQPLTVTVRERRVCSRL